MKTVSEYKENIKTLMDKARAIDANAASENRDLTPNEVQMQAKILDGVEEISQSVNILERKEEIADMLDKPDQRLTVPNEARIEVKAPNSTKDVFASFGEQMNAVMKAGHPGGSADPRLFNSQGMNETTPSDGGFLVQQEYSDEILKNVWDSGMILPRVSKVTLSGNKNSMIFNGLDESSRADGSRAGGISSGWKGEGVDGAKSKPKFRQIELKLNKLIGLCYATDELMDDSSALAQTISEGFKDEFDFKLTDSIINGSGSGQPLGILNSGCVVSVEAETGQGAGTIVYDNINNMWARLMAKSRPNSVWVISQDCEPQLNRMSVAVGTGGIPVYLPAGGIAAQPYSTLFGRPVVPIEQCKTVGTTGDIMLCDFSKIKAIDKGDIQSDISIHVEFLSAESVFRFTYRYDSQPILGSAITPFNGGSTLSHFVKLNSRT